MTEETPPVELADTKAYSEARAGFELGDIALFPNTVQRNFAADRMGLKWGSIDREDPLIESGRYAGALRDVVITLWLGVTPIKKEMTPDQKADGSWSVQRADSRPDEAYEAAQEWAEKIGIKGTDTKEFGLAWKVFLRIKRGEQVSKFRVTTADSAPHGAPDESGNSSGQPHAQSSATE